eukprot:CAMPEP_0202052006 /NCGR_PEP_ID=MMETSP0963-20130614/4984_1 /ASSEMBLY_ACC=CAM_ASM_000494 /TAXON_ID=4773 /ORGANISM="Schizochytrium aggregatum, Strain ATCC28209" /LENGTH=70 /DNA_ID=CAMNT_0048617229 /DNA_START=333 /DNA_END=548 /DNA_ORIENTATION=-
MGKSPGSAGLPAASAAPLCAHTASRLLTASKSEMSNGLASSCWPPPSAANNATPRVVAAAAALHCDGGEQ